MVNNHLVGGWPSPLKNMSSSVGMVKSQLGSWLFPIYGKKKCSKPPTRYWWRLVWSWCLISIDLWPWSKIKLGGILFSDEPMRHCCGQNVRITGVVPLPLHPDAVNGSSNPRARSPSQKYSLRSCSAMSSPSLANDSSSKTLNRNHKFPSVKPISWGCTSTIIHPC